MHWKNI